VSDGSNCFNSCATTAPQTLASANSLHHCSQSALLASNFVHRDKYLNLIDTHTTVWWPFVWDYPGGPVPEETFTHSNPSWPSDILYQLPPSTTIHNILLVQSTCLTVSPFSQPLSTSSLVFLLVLGPLLHIPHISSKHNANENKCTTETHYPILTSDNYIVSNV